MDHTDKFAELPQIREYIHSTSSQDDIHNIMRVAVCLRKSVKLRQVTAGRNYIVARWACWVSKRHPYRLVGYAVDISLSSSAQVFVLAIFLGSGETQPRGIEPGMSQSGRTLA